MEQIKANSILQFNNNQIKNVRNALGYDDVNKLKQDIELLADWIRKQNHFKVKEFDQCFLERLLIYNKGSIERTKQKFDHLCTCINLMPDFLQNFDIKNEFRPLFNVMNLCVLPKPTKDNYRIILWGFTGKDDDEFNIIQLYRYLMVFGYYILNNDYCQGYEWICDTRNMAMVTLVRFNPLIIHKGLTLFTEALGQRVKKLYVISGSKLLDAIMLVAKQALSGKLKERLVPYHNLENLYEHIPRELLSKDLKGDERSTKELSDLNFEELSSRSHIEKVKFMEKAGTDESCRLTCKYNEEYSGVPGSFKTLCID